MSKFLYVIKLDKTFDVSILWTENGRDDVEEFVFDNQFSFYTGRFFRDVALIDFFVLEGKSCFVSSNVPQMRLSATCQSSCT